MMIDIDPLSCLIKKFLCFTQPAFFTVQCDKHIIWFLLPGKGTVNLIKAADTGKNISRLLQHYLYPCPTALLFQIKI